MQSMCSPPELQGRRPPTRPPLPSYSEDKIGLGVQSSLFTEKELEALKRPSVCCQEAGLGLSAAFPSVAAFLPKGIPSPVYLL